ncbi:hypothetical protein ACFQJD_03450 [Haloplanus sp. GCM10025708]|uniref:hypothetical protein n=1 Tax=Haloferacaceae TaxID=1644056 RepID=UPI00361B0C28
MTLLQTGNGEVATVALALAYLAVTVGALVLLYSLYGYVRGLLADTYRERWWYLGAGVGAAVVYGVAGLADVVASVPGAPEFQVGAMLFFFLFLAFGVRDLYSLERGEESPVPSWGPYVVLGGFIVAWWVGYALDAGAFVHAVETVGLTVATSYTIVYAVLTVRVEEGTSIAAVVRHLLPALVCFAGVVLAEQLGQYTGVSPAVVTAIELVGTVLVGAFLFTTAVAIEQQGGEVRRMYDRTTWRGESL